MTRTSHWAGVLACLWFFLSTPAAWAADTYRLVVQPVLAPEASRAAYQPLVDYLSRSTGTRIELVTAQNFLTFWQSMRKSGSYDLILDAAHFTAYRMAKLGYVPLVKLPDVVSFSLVTAEGTLVFSPDELVSKRVATLASPSLGALRLSRMFPNPIRQPIIVEVDNSDDAVKRLLSGDVAAAMIPTPLVANFPLNTVVTTEQVPHMCLSAAPTVPEAVRARIREALLAAGNAEAGRQMLRQSGLPGFVPAEPAQYRGYETLLEGTWGY